MIKGKNNNGITLIVLIIAIIVMLILAGVTISIIVNGGLFGQANTAAEETRGGSVEEERDLWIVEKKVAEYSGTARTLNEVLTNLRQRNLLTDNELNEINTTGQVQIGSRTIVFGKTEEGMEAEYSEITTWIPIYTSEQLQEVGSGGIVKIEQEDGKEYIFEYGTDIGYILKNDIDLSKTDFSPLPKLTSGVFLGNGKTISNITTNEEFCGLFYGNSGIISYLKIKNVNGNSDSESAGIVFINNGIISNCVNLGVVTGRNSAGIAYSNSGGRIIDCYNIGKITGNKNVGGIAVSGGTITNCYNTGEITGGNDAGGIVSYGETIINCYNTGKITGGDAAGGIAGRGTTIEKCYNAGEITGNNEAGGIVGSSGQVANCYNIGTITAYYNAAGGIVGTSSQNVNNCYNIGTVTGTSDNIGGIAGSMYMYPIFDAINCYYLTGVTVNSYGAVKTVEELKDLAEMLGSEWKDDTDNKNNGYPILSWQ